MSTPDLTAEELESCRIAFQKFDKDGSGSISDFELKAMLQCTRSEPAQLLALGPPCKLAKSRARARRGRRVLLRAFPWQPWVRTPPMRRSSR